MMLTSEERFRIGMNVLKRLKSEQHHDKAASELPSRTGSLKTAGPAAFSEDYSVSALLEQDWSISPHSLVLGVCEDGLPFVLDLNNPAPGSILVAGDSESGKTRLLRSILASISKLNQPDQALFSVIARDPEQYFELAQDPNCLDLITAGGSAAEDLIWRLADLVEQRRRGRENGPAIVLIIDDLAAALQPSDGELMARMLKICKHGPRSRVWALASLSSENFELVDERLLAAFRTPLIGRVASQQLTAYLSGDKNLSTHDLAYGKQFLAPLGGEWVRFWICENG